MDKEDWKFVADTLRDELFAKERELEKALEKNWELQGHVKRLTNIIKSAQCRPSTWRLD